MKAASPWRKHAPFVVFMAALFGLAYYLDQNLSTFLPAFHSATILIQLALAATIIAVLRNVVGIKAFGTFAPVILAFSMLFTGLVVGLLLFGTVILVIILTRGAIHGQRVQQSHRAAITGTSVSAALLSGMMALLLQAHPEVNKVDAAVVLTTKMALMQTAASYPSQVLPHDDYYGYGLTRVYEAHLLLARGG
ncbi:MAG: 7TM domain-containing protein [Thermoplasmata archaeon]